MPIVYDAETKFMEHFSVGTAVKPGARIWSAINRDGNVEAFTIGSDGMVYNYFPDPTSDTGYSVTSLGIPATTIGVSANGDGNITVFLSINLALYIVVQQPGQHQRWSAPQPLSYPRPTGAQSIAAIYPTLVGSTIYFALLLSTRSGPYGLAIGSQQSGMVPNFNLDRYKYSTIQCVWLGTTSETLVLAFVDNAITTVTPDAWTQTSLRFSSGFTARSVTAVVDKAENSQVYAILDDGNVYHLISTDGIYSWSPLTQAQSFSSIAGIVTNEGTTDLLLISSSADLSHMVEDPSVQSGFSAPLPIKADVAALTVARNGDGQVDMFVASSSSMTHIFSEQESGNWQMARLEVPQGSSVDVYGSYGSDISIQDELGTPLALTDVTIWTPEPAVLHIGGSVYSVGPDQKAQVTTNLIGILSVQQPTTSTSVPPLLFSVPSQMASDDVATIAQDTVVQKSLVGLTGPELLSATTADGTPVLQGQYRTEKSADSIARAVTTSMQLSLQVAACAPAATAIIGRPRPGLATVGSSGLPALRNLTAISTEGVPSWRLRVGHDGQAVFEALTSEQAAVSLAALRGTTLDAGGFWDFVDDLGDLISGAEQGLLDVVDTLVNAVEGGVHAVITFVVDDVPHVIETVVKTVEQAFDLVESVFAQVKVFFKTLFQWLGYILDRGDITRTARALAYMTTQLLDFADGATAGLQSKCDEIFQALEGQMDQQLDAAIQAIGTSSTIGGYTRSHHPNNLQVSSALSNNVLLNHFIDQAGSRQGGNLVLPQGPGSASDWGDISTELTRIVTGIKEDPGFTSVEQFGITLGQSTDNLFRSAIATLLTAIKALADAILSGVRTTIDLVLQKLRDLIDWVRGQLTAEWDIPVLSTIFSHLFPGLPLTMLNLVAAIAAIPITALYKILLKTTPFADDGAVAEFEQSFSAATMLAASGLGSRTNKDAHSTTPGSGILPGKLQTFMGLAGGSLIVANGIVCSVTDAASKIEVEGLPLERYTIAARITNGIALIALFPWFYDDPTLNDIDVKGHDHAPLWDKGLWIVWLIGFVIDLLLAVLSEQLRFTADEEAMLWCIYGVVYIVIAAGFGSRKTSEISTGLMSVFKLLGLSKAIAASEGLSLLGLALTDFMCAGTAGFIVIGESAL